VVSDDAHIFLRRGRLRVTRVQRALREVLPRRGDMVGIVRHADPISATTILLTLVSQANAVRQR